MFQATIETDPGGKQSSRNGVAVSNPRLKTLLATKATLEAIIDRFRRPAYYDAHKRRENPRMSRQEAKIWNRACVRHSECLKQISKIQAREVMVKI